MGERSLDPALEAALAADQVYPLLFVEVEFTSGMVRAWNGDNAFQLWGSDWVGVGLLLSLSPVEETSEIRAVGVHVGLAGIPSDVLTLALAEDYQGRPARVYLGALDAASGALAGDPVLLFAGSVDTMPINESGDTAQVVVSIESRLLRLEQASRRRYTAADQRFFYPSDAGLDHVAAIQDTQIIWGAASPAPSASQMMQAAAATLVQINGGRN